MTYSKLHLYVDVNGMWSAKWKDSPSARHHTTSWEIRQAFAWMEVMNKRRNEA